MCRGGGGGVTEAEKQEVRGKNSKSDISKEVHNELEAAQTGGVNSNNKRFVSPKVPGVGDANHYIKANLLSELNIAHYLAQRTAISQLNFFFYYKNTFALLNK